MENDTLEKKLDFAKKVVISLVKSPLYNDSLPNVDDELKSYFKNARQLKLNEFFHIKSIVESS